jgi:hypothetical protein
MSDPTISFADKMVTDYNVRIGVLGMPAYALFCFWGLTGLKVAIAHLGEINRSKTCRVFANRLDVLTTLES